VEGVAPELLPPGSGLMAGFERRRIATSGAEINLAVGGSGKPLLLLHGNPLTLVSWHKIAPSLARDFTVVALDLRGYGDSSKPPGGEDHFAYTFRAMAQDGVEVMQALGFHGFGVAGHDRGARVAFRMALDHPRQSTGRIWCIRRSTDSCERRSVSLVQPGCRICMRGYLGACSGLYCHARMTPPGRRTCRWKRMKTETLHE